MWHDPRMLVTPAESAIAVVINLRARRGSDAVLRHCRELLPGARVIASRTADEAFAFLRSAPVPPRLIVSGGGDGTVVGLINAMRRGQTGPASALAPPGEPARSTLALLRLGTGNGWANATGAPAWRSGLAQLRRLIETAMPVPVRTFDLVKVAGTAAHFAGTGKDAEIIDDFHAQQTGPGLLPARWRAGLPGYLVGFVSRTLPRGLTRPLAEVELVNTGEDALTIDDQGRPLPLPGGAHGATLYRGPVDLCAAGTVPEWGFGFRAFPFAGLVPRRFCLRVYTHGILHALWDMRGIWTGRHPMPRAHTWLLTRCQATFSRPVPFQAGGDRIGPRDQVEYALAPEQASLLDWRSGVFSAAQSASRRGSCE